MGTFLVSWQTGTDLDLVMLTAPIFLRMEELAFAGPSVDADLQRRAAAGSPIFQLCPRLPGNEECPH
jgi:hypothetical protein